MKKIERHRPDPPKAAPRPRAGWDQAFKAMAELGDDRLLNPHPESSDWDNTEWRW